MAPGMAGAALPGIGGLLPAVPGFAAAAAPTTSSSPVPTCFICVNGMITADVLKDEAEYKEV